MYNDKTNIPRTDGQHQHDMHGARSGQQQKGGPRATPARTAPAIQNPASSYDLMILGYMGVCL
jgi:hypothetical protein